MPRPRATNWKVCPAGGEAGSSVASWGSVSRSVGGGSGGYVPPESG
jgi:hypothetical protein